MVTTVAVLGTGIMGYPMAANLLGAGFAVRAWNRTGEKAAPLGDRGASVAESPADAVRGADVVLTMLIDGDAVRDTLAAARPGLHPDALWLQASTVGPEHADRLAELAAGVPVAYLDCPVLGTRGPAESGDLVVLASGPAELRERAQPVFDAIGSRTLWVGEAGAGSRLKLVVNSWVLAVVGAVAEAVALAEAFGLDPRSYLDTLSGTALDLPYARLKGDAMIRDEFPASFPVAGARKDAQLITAAMASRGLHGRVAGAVLATLEATAAAGYADADMAAAIHGVRA